MNFMEQDLLSIDHCYFQSVPLWIIFTEVIPIWRNSPSGEVDDTVSRKVTLLVPCFQIFSCKGKGVFLLILFLRTKGDAGGNPASFFICPADLIPDLRDTGFCLPDTLLQFPFIDKRIFFHELVLFPTIEKFSARISESLLLYRRGFRFRTFPGKIPPKGFQPVFPCLHPHKAFF